MGGICWVAREVYGPHDPRWLVFRGWLTSEAPRWLRDLYIAHGEAFADWLHERPVSRRGVRMLMDIVVVPRMERAQPRAGGHFQVSGAVQHLARREKPASVPAGANPAGAAKAQQPDQEDRVVAEAIGLPANVLDAQDLPAAVRDYLSTAGKPDAKPTDDREYRRRLAQLRNSAAWLGAQKEFGKAADLIAAAIAGGHAEPWMYEALALVTEAAGRPRSDVERVLLSSADFASGPTELATLARYLARLGFPEQAIRICRRITRLEPTNSEAYALAMTLAAEREDVATLLWACPGVLAHEWPAAQRDLAIRAGRIAKSTIDSLKKAGRKEEAAALEAAADRALVRDLVVEISWTGDADVDVFIEEPTGSVCSRSTPRTLSGGVLLADDAAGQDRSGKIHKERYVVAEAFPGRYRILVRRVFGKVAADTVTVRTTVRARAANEETKTSPLRLAGNEQTLTIELPDGRRREPLLDAQIAQDVVVQQHVTKTVLAQQLTSLADPAVAASMADSPRSNPGAGGPGFPGFGRNGVVGYQPQVSVLPEGVNLFARAVVSADRRYVRVTATPLFSTVGQVQQFGGGGTAAGGGGGVAAAGPAAAGGAAGGAGVAAGGAAAGAGVAAGGAAAGAGVAAGGAAAGAGVAAGGAAAGGAAAVGAGGGVGVADGTPNGCWVAREVYGDDNPRWIIFRHWLLTEAPAGFRDLYIARGESFAAWIHDKPVLKLAIRTAMDRAVDRVLTRAAVSCPDSE
jgi:tetratricopeptide (TPR) repeat protein